MSPREAAARPDEARRKQQELDELFARIKGVPTNELAGVVERQLVDFDLKEYENKLAGSLSGGNKRKLSVAIALIGNPPIVFLDEPSTGVDPVARRFMWSVISRQAANVAGCSIILTTHSMEEVEALCTRIGIMVGGRLRCLGTAQHLKNRHGSGFVSQLQLAPPSLVAVDTALQAVAAFLGPSRSSDGHAAVISGNSLKALCTHLGAPARFGEVSSNGSGWLVAQAVAWSPDGERCATVSKDCTLVVWDAACGAQLGFFMADGALSAVRFALTEQGEGDSCMLVAGTDSGVLHFCDLDG